MWYKLSDFRRLLLPASEVNLVQSRKKTHRYIPIGASWPFHLKRCPVFLPVPKRLKGTECSKVWAHFWHAKIAASTSLVLVMAKGR